PRSACHSASRRLPRTTSSYLGHWPLRGHSDSDGSSGARDPPETTMQARTIAAAAKGGRNPDNRAVSDDMARDAPMSNARRSPSKSRSAGSQRRPRGAATSASRATTATIAGAHERIQRVRTSRGFAEVERGLASDRWGGGGEGREGETASGRRPSG